jgi:hypothetical protein
MSGRGMTRRSLLAATAGAATGGALGAAALRAKAAEARGPVTFASLDAAATPSATLQTLPQTLPVGPGQPPMLAREAWTQGRCPPKVTPEYGEVLMAFVHHTENPNGYSREEVPRMLRAIYQFHRYGRGWNDIGYNFVVDRFGRIFEARAGGVDEPVTGAQAGGYNYCSSGIAVLGEYGAQGISPAARRALAHLLAWKLSLHGVPIKGRVTVRVNPAGAIYSRFPARSRVSLPRIAGHRDADSTNCPGNALYGELPGLRRATKGLAGKVARLTLAAQRDEGGAIVALSGALRWLGGTAEAGGIAGAPIQLQARTSSQRGELVSEQTLAQVQTGPDGSFTAPIAQQQAGPPGMSLRALCPGAAGVPAAVSPPLRLTGTVSFASPAAPPTPATPPAPASQPTP